MSSQDRPNSSHAIAAALRLPHWAIPAIGIAAGLGCNPAPVQAQDVKADGASAGQAASAPVIQADGHVIAEVRIEFARDHPANPKAADLLDCEIEVADMPGAVGPPGDGEGRRRIRLVDIAAPMNLRFTDQGLALLAPAVVRKLKDLGYVGVYVIPDPAQFRVADGRVVDTRPPGVAGVTLQVTLSQVTELRTVGLGERVDPDKTVNNSVHGSIKRRSPIRPASPDGQERQDLLVRPALDDYIFRLNRHPGRRADVAVSAAGDQPGAVMLDYLVTENRPWLVFGQISNTGSAGTSRLREQFGFVHNQLTNDDDILQATYQTANFNDVHALNGSYERPLFTDLLRGRVFGSWYQYVASEVGQAGADFTGNGWNLGGEVAWNFLQRRETFLDLVGGLRFEHIAVDNSLAAVQGSEDFLLPSIGLRLERQTEAARTNAYVGLEFNIGGTDSATLDTLGRLNADDRWTTLKGQFTHSFYLDPLFRDDPAAAGGLANEVLLSLNGQSALGSRLVPNFEQTAGGLYSVRGYPESVVAGDTVIQGTLEYRYHLAKGLDPQADPGELFGRAFRFRPQYRYGPTDWDLVLKAFVDGARVVNSSPESFEVDSTLLGAGIGAELSITRRFSLRLDWGFALRDIRDATGATTVNAGHNELQFVLTCIY